MTETFVKLSPEIMLSNGKYYNFLDPDESVLTIEVIAHALSMMCRFSGHVSRFYSVAEHCWRCSWIGPEDEALERLMHDAAEALVVDLPSPLKRMDGMDAYREADRRAERTIANRFELRYPWPASVHEADLVMLATERRDLLPVDDNPNSPWGAALIDGVTPLAANLGDVPRSMAFWECAFIKRFNELQARR